MYVHSCTFAANEATQRVETTATLGNYPLQSDLPVNKQGSNESFSTDGNRFNLKPKQKHGPTEKKTFFLKYA